MGIFTKLFGTYSQRQIKRVLRTVDKIEGMAEIYSAMSDVELSGVTDTLKARLSAGESTDDILP